MARAVDGLAPAEADLLEALRSGDEAAFGQIVDELSPGMLRMARLYVATDAAAEEVVQETWLGALKGLDGFEGRSSLKTWLYRILINVAKTRGVRDQRSVPFSSAFDARAERDEGVVDSERSCPRSHDRWPGHWAVGPTPWPDEAAETAESIELIRTTVAGLPGPQREVITLRDIVGCSAGETCTALG